MSRDDIGLAVNSREARSQDQLHIHIACIDPGIHIKIAAFERAITRTWSLFPIRLASRGWWAMRLEEDDLESNPFHLLRQLKSTAGGSMEDWGMALLAWAFADGSEGFLLFATRDDAIRAHVASAAKIAMVVRISFQSAKRAPTNMPTVPPMPKARSHARNSLA